jgi:hypothetical protein
MDIFEKAINEHFERGKNKLSFTKLIELVESELKVLESVIPGAKDMLTEAGPQTITVDVIPSIPVSELGWSDVRTTDKGTQVDGPQRQALISYLNNIKGSTLQEKLSSLNQFYSEGLKLPGNTSPATKVSKILSYLVFYKTLTSIIQNFNASSAGFSFESFLGAMLNGKQVPTGEGTIADLIAGNGTPISLKLYSEASVEVGGSFTDLVGDLTRDPRYMQYIVCMKDLEGRGMDQQGAISWYRFNFTLDNVANIISQSKDESSRCIQLPISWMEAIQAGNSDYDVESVLPSGDKAPSAEEVETMFVDNVNTLISKTKGIDLNAQEIENLVSVIDFANKDEMFLTVKRGDRNLGVVRGLSAMAKSSITRAVFGAGLVPDAKNTKDPFLIALVNIVHAANEVIRKEFTAKKIKSKRSAALKEMKFASIEDSVSFYNNLTPEQKMAALKNSQGFLKTYQFSLNRGHVYNIQKFAGTQTSNLFDEGQSEVRIGVTNVGQKYIQEMLDRVVEEINDSVFVIVENLKVLTSSLNSYFAGGLKKDRDAVTAIKASNTIEGKTEELRPDEK